MLPVVPAASLSTCTSTLSPAAIQASLRRLTASDYRRPVGADFPVLSVQVAGRGLGLFFGQFRVHGFTFGIRTLEDGLGLVPVIMGLFGISEVLLNLERREEKKIKGMNSFN